MTSATRARGRGLAAAVAATALLAGCARPAATDASGSTSSTAPVTSTTSSAAPSIATSARAATSATAPASASATGTGRGAVSTPLPQCAASKLPTRTKGVLTVAAPSTLSTPWFAGSTPTAGGLDPAVVGALATTLGFAADAVHWVRADPAAVAAGTASGYDVAIGEWRIPDQTGGPVDYTTGYFTIPTVIVAKSGQAPAATLAAIRGVRVAAAGDTQAVTATVGSSTSVSSFPTAAAALDAVRAGTAQVAAVDAVTALDARDLSVVGALAPAGKTADRQLGLVVPRGSTLTSCLSTALDVLRIQGTLASISAHWARLTTLR